MGCIQLGSKADMFHLEGKSWLSSSGLPSDICIRVGEMSFHLHKFPLLSRSRLLEKLIQEFSINQRSEEKIKCILSLDDLPGGSNSFLLVSKFCYNIKLELTASNVVDLRCAAEYLQMTEDHGEQNLISQTEAFLNNEVFTTWADTIKALQTCHAMLPLSEELHIISRCIDSLSTIAITGPIPDWWYEDVAVLEMPLFKRVVMSFSCKGMKPDRIGGSIMFYAKKYLPLNGRQTGFQKPVSRKPILPNMDQRALVEDIVELIPYQKSEDQMGPTFTAFLLKLLKISMILDASESACDSLERRIGTRLDEAVLQDLLIPNAGYSMETLYDIECVQRIVEHFLIMEQENDDDSKLDDELMECSSSVKRMTMVANLLDSYLAEVASDGNLKLEKFLVLADAIPGYARTLDDGIYRSIDTYLKAHPSLTDSEKEKLCSLMDYQKLSLEASSHAAQNERLPLRVVVQILFFEQLRLRTSVTGWLFVSDNLENSENLSGVIGNELVAPEGGQIVTFDDVKGRVCELEKECENMKNEIEKIVKRKGKWNNLCRRLGIVFKGKSMLSCNGEAVQPSRKAVLNRKDN